MAILHFRWRCLKQSWVLPFAKLHRSLPLHNKTPSRWIYLRIFNPQQKQQTLQETAFTSPVGICAQEGFWWVFFGGEGLKRALFKPALSSLHLLKLHLMWVHRNEPFISPVSSAFLVSSSTFRAEAKNFHLSSDSDLKLHLEPAKWQSFSTQRDLEEQLHSGGSCTPGESCCSAASDLCVINRTHWVPDSNLTLLPATQAVCLSQNSVSSHPKKAVLFWLPYQTAAPDVSAELLR